MHRARARRGVAYGSCYVIRLIAEPDLGADSIAVASRPDELQDEPVVRVGADVLPKLCRLTESAHDHIDFSVVVKIGKGASPVCARKIKASFDRYIAERSVPEIGEETVGLLVVRGSKKIDQVVHIGICGEQVLPAIIVEIEETVAPAAARGGERGKPALVGHLLKGTFAEVLK